MDRSCAYAPKGNDAVEKLPRKNQLCPEQL
jgi:hypothetical protein